MSSCSVRIEAEDIESWKIKLLDPPCRSLGLSETDGILSLSLSLLPTKELAGDTIPTCTHSRSIPN